MQNSKRNIQCTFYVSRKNEKLLMYITAGLLNGDHGTLGARVIMA